MVVPTLSRSAFGSPGFREYSSRYSCEVYKLLKPKCFLSVSLSQSESIFGKTILHLRQITMRPRLVPLFNLSPQRRWHSHKSAAKFHHFQGEADFAAVLRATRITTRSAACAVCRKITTPGLFVRVPRRVMQIRRLVFSPLPKIRGKRKEKRLDSRYAASFAGILF